MPIVKTINTVEAFRAEIERADRRCFSYSAQEALFEHLSDLSDATGEPVELDVISLCGEFTEWTREEAIAELAEEGTSTAPPLTDDAIVEALAEMFGTAFKFEYHEWNYDHKARDLPDGTHRVEHIISTRFMTTN